MFETNLSEIITYQNATIHYIVNGTLNVTEPIDIQVFGEIPPIQVPYMDLIFQLTLVNTICLVFVVLILFLILIKRGRVTL